jgi:hypothetical protein
MRWEDERYVRVYVRDTADWLALGWEAQSLLVLTMRKVDRAGLLELGRAGVRGLAAVVGMPLDVVERALPVLLEDGCVVLNGSTLVVPNFIEAQEAAQSDAHRKRESRARARDRAAASVRTESRNVTDAGRNVTTEPDPVTSGHVGSQSVTPNCAVPSRAVPSEETPPLAREREQDEGHDLGPEAEEHTAAARHETASEPTPHPTASAAETPREPATIAPATPGPLDAAPPPARRARRDLRAEDYPETARLLVELESAGFLAAYPRDAISAGALERAVASVGVTTARERVMAVVEADRALRVESRPWLGWYLDAIQGQQPRARAARAASGGATDIRVGVAAPAPAEAFQGGERELR